MAETRFSVFVCCFAAAMAIYFSLPYEPAVWQRLVAQPILSSCRFIRRAIRARRSSMTIRLSPIIGSNNCGLIPAG